MTDNDPDGDGSDGATFTTTLALAVDPVVDFLQERAPFSYIGISMLLGLLAAYIFQRRYGIAINIGVSRRQ